VVTSLKDATLTRESCDVPVSNGNRPKKRAVSRKVIIAAALILLVAAAAVQHFYFSGQAPAADAAMRMADTGVTVKYDLGSGAGFASFDSGNFFFCTKDGMKYMTSSGAQKWDSVFTLTAPVMVSQGGVAAVGEANGHAAYVFDSTGKLYEEHFDGAMLSFSVNKAGDLAVILQNGTDGYLIEAFGPGLPTWQYHFVDANIYPVSADVSPDGRIVAIACADVNYQLTTKVVFAYVNQADGQSFTDMIFSEQDIDGEMPASVRFMDGNRLLVFTDARICCYQPQADSSVTQLWNMDLNNQIGAVGFYGGKSFAYACGAALLNHQNADPVGTVSFVALDGTTTGSYCVGKDVTSLTMGFDSAIAGTDREFYAISKTGGLLWNYASPQNAGQMIFLDNTNTVLLAADAGGDIMKRVKQ